MSHLQKSGVPVTDDLPKYTWYEPLESEIVAFYSADKSFPEQISPKSGVVGVLLKQTSFYAESGGQIADRGSLSGATGR